MPKNRTDTTPKITNDLLTKEQVAAIFRVHSKTVLRWAESGCPHYRAAGERSRLLFRQSEVETWMRVGGS